MPNFRRKAHAGALLGAGLMPGHAIHAADTFPTRPMRIIVPAFQVDEMARPLARLIGPVSCMERLVCYLGGPIEHD